MMAGIKYIVYGLLTLCPLYDALLSHLTCLKCDDVARPTVCKFIDRCGQHEVCSIVSTVTPIGSILFTLGCIDRKFCGARKRGIPEQEDGSSSGTEICNECCTGDLCNSAGCGQKGFSPDLEPVCHFCDLHIGPSSCSEIKQCGRDQMCMGGHTISTQDSGQHSTDTCNVCCSTNVCNNQVPAYCTAIHVPTHEPTTTRQVVTNASIVTNAPSITKTTAITNAPHTSPSGCDYLGASVAHKYKGSCYVYEPHGDNWGAAENKCKEHGGHLVTIDNAEENHFILQMMSGQQHHSIWIGLHHGDSLTWTSGSTSIFRQFIPGYRHSDHDKSDCVAYMTSGLVTGWDDRTCIHHHGFICEIPPQTTNIPTASPVGSSPQIYGDRSRCSHTILVNAMRRPAILYGVAGTTHCYTLEQYNYTWNHAQYTCEHTYNAHLVEIGATSSYNNWNTATDTHKNADTNDGHLCVYMTVNDGKWNLAYCGHHEDPNGKPVETHYFLCEHDPSSFSTQSQSAIVG